MGADPFEDALSELEGGDPFEAALAEAAPQAETAGPALTAVLSAADTGLAAKQIGAGMRTAVQFTQNPYGDVDPIETYRAERDAITQGLEQAQAANPVAAGFGTAAGIGIQIATGGVNPYSLAKSVYTTGRSLLTREGAGAAVQAGRALLTREGAYVAATEVGKTAATGAAISGAYGLAESKADLTKGEFIPALEDAVRAAVPGALLGGGGRILGGAGSAALEGRAAAAATRAGTARAVGEFDAATAALPEQQAAAQAAAQTAVEAETRANPLLRTGLETKLQAQYGPKVAKARGRALVNEPLPGDPSKKLIEEAEKLDPETRFDYATGLRREQGAVLGQIRDELAAAAPNEVVPVGPIRDQIRGAFSQFPAEIQAAALEKVDALIGSVSKEGGLSPGALRKVIEDVDGLAKHGSPSLQNTLGRSQKRVFRTTYGVLVDRERELLGKVMPNRLPEYLEGNRRYGVYSDFEASADQLFRRANKGQKALRIPKAAKVDVEAPQFPGGEDALAAGRKLLQPSAAAQVGAEAIRYGIPSAAGAAGYAVGGPMVGGLSAAVAGAKLSKPAADLWLRVMTPTTAKLTASAGKLERLAPMMEEALRKGPAEVARIHAIFMARSPDYRKAIESGE